MTCATVKKNAAAFVDRELSARLHRAKALHTTRCPPRHELVEVQARIKRLVQAGAKTLSAPAALRQRIQNRLWMKDSGRELC